MSENTVKADGGKLRYDLMPFDALDKVAEVLTYGIKKYPKPKENWRVNSSKEDIPRYKAALLRHYSAMAQGQVIDDESGLPHMAHIATNSLFILALEQKFGIYATKPSGIYLKSQGPDYKGEVLSVYGARFFVKFECEKSPCLITREEFSYAI